MDDQREVLRTLVRDMLSDQVGHAPESALDITSLEVVRLLVSLEDRLDIDFDDAAIMNLELGEVDDVVDLIERSLGTRTVTAEALGA